MGEVAGSEAEDACALGADLGLITSQIDTAPKPLDWADAEKTV